MHKGVTTQSVQKDEETPLNTPNLLDSIGASVQTVQSLLLEEAITSLDESSINLEEYVPKEHLQFMNDLHNDVTHFSILSFLVVSFLPQSCLLQLRRKVDANFCEYFVANTFLSFVITIQSRWTACCDSHQLNVEIDEWKRIWEL